MHAHCNGFQMNLVRAIHRNTVFEFVASELSAFEFVVLSMNRCTTAHSNDKRLLLRVECSSNHSFIAPWLSAHKMQSCIMSLSTLFDAIECSMHTIFEMGASKWYSQNGMKHRCCSMLFAVNRLLEIKCGRMIFFKSHETLKQI